MAADDYNPVSVSSAAVGFQFYYNKGQNFFFLVFIEHGNHNKTLALRGTVQPSALPSAFLSTGLPAAQVQEEESRR